MQPTFSTVELKKWHLWRPCRLLLLPKIKSDSGFSLGQKTQNSARDDSGTPYPWQSLVRRQLRWRYWSTAPSCGDTQRWSERSSIGRTKCLRVVRQHSKEVNIMLNIPLTGKTNKQIEQSSYFIDTAVRTDASYALLVVSFCRARSARCVTQALLPPLAFLFQARCATITYCSPIYWFRLVCVLSKVL